MDKVKNISLVILLIVVGVLVYSFKNSSTNNKKMKSKLELSKKQEKVFKNKIDSVNYIIVGLNDSLELRDGYIIDLQKSQHKTRNEANDYRKKYIALTKKKPLTIEDSLEVSNEMVDVLVKSNDAQEVVINKLDSVIALQGYQITDLKDIVKNQKIVISNKDGLLVLKEREIQIYKDEIKKQKIKKFKFLGVGGLGGFALALLILL